MTDWTTPITWIFEQVVTEDDLNEQIRDNMTFLHYLAEAIVLVDQKAQNTAGGGTTTGSYLKHDLTTEVRDPSNRCSLVSSAFTLTAGTYLFLSWVTGYKCGLLHTRLYNSTDAVAVATVYGGSAASANADAVSVLSVALGVFTITGSKTFELQYQASVAQATNGLGIAGNFGVETYAGVILLPIAG